MSVRKNELRALQGISCLALFALISQELWRHFGDAVALARFLRESPMRRLNGMGRKLILTRRRFMTKSCFNVNAP